MLEGMVNLGQRGMTQDSTHFVKTEIAEASHDVKRRGSHAVANIIDFQRLLQLVLRQAVDVQ